MTGRVEVHARSREAADRCPYCHDLMDVDPREVLCGACGTRHHAACVDELGRCTVLGCAWTRTGAPAPHVARSVDEVRRALRARVKAFVKDNARPPGPAPRVREPLKRRPRSDDADVERWAMSGRRSPEWRRDLGTFVKLLLAVGVTTAIAAVTAALLQR
jgi:hypothetical protein